MLWTLLKDFLNNHAFLKDLLKDFLKNHLKDFLNNHDPLKDFLHDHDFLKDFLNNHDSLKDFLKETLTPGSSTYNRLWALL